MTIMRKKYLGYGLAPTLSAICLLVKLITVLLTACTTTEPNPVKLEASTFAPSSITIKKGEKITLINDTDDIPHKIENGTWDSGAERPKIAPRALIVDTEWGGRQSETIGPFTTAGTFQLYCTYHQDMNLTVIVK